MPVTMPIQQESDYDSKKGGGGTPPKELWKGLPFKAGSSHTNSVLVLTFSPHTWQLFNPTPEVAAKYRMVGSGLQGMVASDVLETFYLKLPVHTIYNYQRPDGSVGYADVLCPIEMNKYLVEALGRNPLFSAPVRCAHCEEEKRRWDAHNARWESLGIEKRDLTTEGYRAQIDADPILRATKDAAREMQVKDRYVISIFDLDKFVGLRPLDDGEVAVEKQVWMAPGAVKDKLLTLWRNQMNFCENTPAGFPILGIVKDTEKCKPNMMMKTRWDVLPLGRFYTLDPAWAAYVTDVNTSVDPSKFVHLITYEEALYYIQSEKEQAHGGNDYEKGAPPVGNHAAYPPSAPVGMPPAAYGVPAMPPVTSSPMQPPVASPVAAMPPMGAPPAAMPPMGAPPAAMPPMGAPIQTYATVMGPPMGAPPAAMPPAYAPPAPAAMPPMGAPPAAMPPMSAPPVYAPPAPAAMPPMGAPPGSAAPVPMQPPAYAPPSPVTMVDASTIPPNRIPPPPSAAGDGPAKRKW